MRKFTLALTAGIVLVAAPAQAGDSSTVVHYTGTASKTVAVDKSGHHNDGTLHHVRVVRGFYRFDEPARIVVPASKSINPGTADYTYGLRMRLPNDYVYDHDLSLVRRGASKLSGAFYKMELIHHKDSATTILVCAMRDQDGHTGYIQRPPTGLDDGKWHTLTCAKDDTSVTLTIDGTAYSNPATVGTLSSSRSLNFGAEQVDADTSWEHFPGDLDNITITKG